MWRDGLQTQTFQTFKRLDVLISRTTSQSSSGTYIQNFSTMAEVVGLVISGVGLVSLANTVSDPYL